MSKLKYTEIVIQQAVGLRKQGQTLDAISIATGIKIPSLKKIFAKQSIVLSREQGRENFEAGRKGAAERRKGAVGTATVNKFSNGIIPPDTIDSEVPLKPSEMIWKCSTPDCSAPRRIRLRSQYKDIVYCGACSNRIKAADKEMTKRRGESISRAIAQRGTQWSETAKRNMSSEETRQKIGDGIRRSYNEKPENRAISRETAIKNNAQTGFGTSEFGIKAWYNIPEDRKAGIRRRGAASAIATDRMEHERLMNERWPGYSVINFGHPNNLYQCPEKHRFLMRGGNFLKRGSCPECAPKSSQEVAIAQFVASMGVEVLRNKRVLKNEQAGTIMELDILVPSLNLAIEYNGIYYHQSDKVGATYHRQKYELAKKQGVRLIQIFEDEWLTKADIVKSMLKARMGVTDVQIYARNTEVKQIDLADAAKFCDDNHLQGSCRGIVAWGLMYENKLVSILVLRNVRKKPGVIEIARYCSLLNHGVVGGFDKLMKPAVQYAKDHGYYSMLTYADARYSEGGVYSRHFRYDGMTVPDLFFVYKTQRFDRHVVWGMAAEDKLKYHPIHGVGHHRFVLKLK